MPGILSPTKDWKAIMQNFSRRNILAATTVVGAVAAIGAAAKAASFGNPDFPPRGPSMPATPHH
jgi:hypothetical protein